MRVLISTGWFGGEGGAERALESILKALAGHDIDVVVRRIVGERDPGSARLRVFELSHWRWYGSGHRAGPTGWIHQNLLNPVRRRLGSYDLYIQSMTGPDLTPVVGGAVRLLVPSGSLVPPDLADRFDHVAMQAPDNVRFVPEGRPTVLLPPPVYPLSGAAEPLPDHVPTAFYLTAFNPYGSVKGTDDLLAAAQDAPLPIVWCRSEATLSHDIPEPLGQHPNIVHVLNPTAGQLITLYRSTSAYLCFSKTEGFGWSIADALRYSGCIVSRPIGVLTFDEARLPSVHRLDEGWAVNWARIPREPAATPLDPGLAWLSPERFRRTVEGLVGA